MAILNNLIVNGAARFLNKTYFDTISADKIDANEGIFKKLVAKDSTLTDVTVVGLMDVTGELHTKSFTNSNIATIDGSFYITPTLGLQGANTTTNTVTVTANSLSFANASGTSFSFESLYLENTTSPVAWSTGSSVIVTGEIQDKTTGEWIPLGTLKGTLSTYSTTSVVINSIKDSANGTAPVTLAAIVASGTTSGLKYRNIKVSLVSINRSGLKPLGIFMTATGSNGRTFLDIYGGNNVEANTYGGLSTPVLRIGNLNGLPSIQNIAPTGWGIYTTNGFFSGTVAADRGKIGGWNIGTDNNKSLYTGTFNSSGGIYISPSYSGTLTVGGNTSRNWAFTAGNAFGVTTAGVLYASGAQIQGDLKANTLATGTKISSTSGNGFYVDSSGNIYVGNESTNNFTVTSAGVLTATGATLKSLTIQDSSGNTVGTFASDIILGQTSSNKYNIQITSNAINLRYNAITLNTINNDGMTLFDSTGTDAIASFGDTVSLGKDGRAQLVLGDSSISGISNYGTEYFNIQVSGSTETTTSYSYLKSYGPESISSDGTRITISSTLNMLDTGDVFRVRYCIRSSKTAPSNPKEFTGTIDDFTKNTSRTGSFKIPNVAYVDYEYDANTNYILLTYRHSGQFDYLYFTTWAKITSTTETPTYCFGLRHENTYGGKYSFNYGYKTTASGDYTSAGGYFSEATGDYSYAEGRSSTATGDCGHAEGYGAKATGGKSHAEGWRSTASGSTSHSEGYETLASGDESHAEGHSTVASGSESHAEGLWTIAQGAYSHAQNYRTVALKNSQTVIGKYNTATRSGSGTSADPYVYTDVGDYAFIIGNGTADTTAERSNALTVDWNGIIGAENVNSYGTCSTAANTAAKVCNDLAFGNFTLQTGARVAIKFAYTNTASSPTLNINGTGAIPIKQYGTAAAGASAAGSWNAGSIVDLTYDGTNWIIDNFLNSTYYYTSVYVGTAASTAGKVGTCSNYALQKGHLQVLIMNANTSAGAITLNINGTGAKPIYINGTASSASNYTLPKAMYLVYYDGTNFYFRTDGKITGSITGVADGCVPTSRTVNGKALSSNITLAASDVGALSTSGGTISGNLTVSGIFKGQIQTDASTLPQFSGAPSYLVGIEAFADGGTMKRQSASSVNVGYATSAGSASSAASLTGTLPVNQLTWAGGVNLTPTASANGQEWSIDLNPGSYTGCYWHVWSSKNSKSILCCYPDNNEVTIPNGPLTVGGVTRINNSLYSDILYTGSGVVNGNLSVGGTLYQSSDRRLKKHLNYLGKDAITFIQNLKPAHYIKDEKEYVGFYAQDVDKIDYWGTMTEINEDNYYSLNYSEIIAPLVTYCHYLEERIKKLEER